MVRSINGSWAFVSLTLCLTACGDVLEDGTARGSFRGSDGNTTAPDGGSTGTSTGGGGGNAMGCVPFGQPLSAVGDSNAATSAVLSMELDSAGKPTVAWSFGNAAGAKPVFVSSYTGTTWQGLAGSDSGAGVGTGSGGVGLKLDSNGRPVAAWLNVAGSPTAFLKAWSGAAWTGLGGSDVGLPQSALGAQFPRVRLALATGDLPVLVWQESASPANVNGIQWSGTAWSAGTSHTVASSPLAPNTPVAAYPEVLRGADGSPVTLYTDAGGITLSSSSITASLGVANNTNGSNATRLAGAAAANGNTVVAWQATNLSGTLNIFLTVIGPTGSLQDLAGSGSGSGLSQSSGGAQHTSVDLDAQGNPVIVWEDMATHQLILRHWNGTAWVALAGAPNTLTQAKSLAAWPVVRVRNGNAVVAWHEDGASIKVCSLAL